MMSFERNQDVEKETKQMDSRPNTETDLKPVTDTEFHNLDKLGSLPSLPKIRDLKEGDETEEPFLLPSVKVRRRSLDWTDEFNLDMFVERKDGVSERGDEPAESIVMKTFLRDLQKGIGVSLDRLPSYPDRDLLMTDFNIVEENLFGKKGPNTADTEFLVNAYAPVAFRYFRKLFGIVTEDFKNSICNSKLYPVNSNSRSGSKFFTTRDDLFILKTVQKKEANFLIDLFPGYFLNLTQHTKTLLPKYYGLFCHVTKVSTVRVLVMNNILPLSYNFYEKYDLKGSTYSKRQSLKSPVEGDVRRSHILKDLDFLENWPDGFYLHPQAHKVLLKSIERDCKVLESYNIMDYSLLLGIVFPDEPNAPVKQSNFELLKPAESLKRNKNLIGPFEARTIEGSTVYLFVGIIDILQSYSWKKKIECQVKSLLYSKSTISVNRPDFYSQRFQNFLSNNVFKCTSKVVLPAKKESFGDLPEK